MIEVEIRQDQLRRTPLQHIKGARFVGGGQDFAAPLPQQRGHALQDAQFVVDHQ
ncbi:hypothetical protein D3C86_2241020 [compost metagenome]